MNPPKHPVLDQHRDVLRSSFAEWVLAENPSDVLELGAGAGELLEHLAVDGVAAWGIENSGESLARARSLGRDVREGSIDDAAFVAPSAEWITIRHVLHHLAHPQRLMVRATAAARRGVFVSEPFCGTGLTGHEWGARLEALMRSLDRRGGMLHGADLTVVEICELVPMDWDVEIRSHTPMTYLPAPEVKAMLEKSAARAGLTLETLGKADADEAGHVLSAAEAGMVSAAGSVVVKACRPAGAY